MATERRRRRGPLAVAAASLASFLAVLALLTAQLHAGHDPALAQVVAASGSGGKQIVTRSSGGAVITHKASTAPGHHATITTRASGGEGDD